MQRHTKMLILYLFLKITPNCPLKYQPLIHCTIEPMGNDIVKRVFKGQVHGSAHQWITPTLPTLNLLSPEGFISWLMNLPLFARALVKWLPGACADSWEIIKRESLKRKFHTRAIYSLLIGSLTMLWNNIACVPALNREPFPLNGHLSKSQKLLPLITVN